MNEKNTLRSQPSELSYLSGFGNHFSTEARSGALPTEQNSPQRPSLGLYAEQLSGSAFTAPRSANLATWLYRIRPAVMQGRFVPQRNLTAATFFPPHHLDPNPMRWNRNPEITSGAEKYDFLEGLRTVVGTSTASAAVAAQRGIQVHLFSFGKQMIERSVPRAMMNADGDFIFVPQSGTLRIRTELGTMEIEPGEIAVVPRGIRFQVDSTTLGVSTGYVGENFGSPLVLPELGPIGANGLAHRRHFLTPVAAFEDLDVKYELVGKFGGELWTAELSHSPFDVVAWHGNYVPYKYDLRKFNTIGTVSFDHPDPSIFTVLTSPSDTPGVANIDFVIFPPRWMVAENTFRPPYFHRNCMSEFMGLIYGVYDAKTSGGFVPGGASLHNFYSAHGPDAGSHEKASAEKLEPTKIDQTLAFMFETRAPYRVTDFALTPGFLQNDYAECWQEFRKHFHD